MGLNNGERDFRFMLHHVCDSFLCTIGIEITWVLLDIDYVPAALIVSINSEDALPQSQTILGQ